MQRACYAVALIASAVLVGRTAAQTTPDALDATPQTLEAFRASVARVLEDTGVPGAGLALVGADSVEWAGGVGFADRDAQTLVTAQTHFRVGSISKTFVAMALVQLSEDGLIDLDAPLMDVAPEVAFENPWEATAPVRVIHLLQHTAGFDDMHFNEMYNLTDPPDLSLGEVLALNPRSRRTRWPPGTRMSYANPGYGVAGYLIEKLAGEPYEDYIRRKIFGPLGMTTSSFRLQPADESLLARGYQARFGPPVPFSPIYLRPAGNLHTSPYELATFVQMLLGWGQLGEAFVIDPEYLSNMERPRATIASAAGLRNGYGSGISQIGNLPYAMLGHGGGIDGFVSLYAYSPSREVGFVVLLNSTHSAEAMSRLSSLAVRYLKRDIEPPARPEAVVGEEELARHEGYYHGAAPRQQVMAFVQWLASGRTIVRQGRRLFSDSVFGPRVPLIPVSETMFRLEKELTASHVFATDGSGAPVLTGIGIYAERRPRWSIEMVRVPVLLATFVVLTPAAALVVWLARLRRPRARGFWALRIIVALVPVVLAAPLAALAITAQRFWGTVNWATALAYLGPLSLAPLALAIGALAFDAAKRGANRWLLAYSVAVMVATTVIVIYLWYWGVLGLRMWAY